MTQQEPRKPPFWQLPGTLARAPNGTKIQEESLGADQTLLHVTFPPTVPQERIANFAQAFSREMPKNVKAIFTVDDVQVRVHRPRSVNINFSDNVIEGEFLLEQIRTLVEDQRIQTATIIIRNNKIIVPDPSPPKKAPVRRAKKTPAKKKKEGSQ